MEYIVSVGISFTTHKTVIADTEAQARMIVANIVKGEIARYNIPGYRNNGIDLLVATPREDYDKMQKRLAGGLVLCGTTF